MVRSPPTRNHPRTRTNTPWFWLALVATLAVYLNAIEGKGVPRSGPDYDLIIANPPFIAEGERLYRDGGQTPVVVARQVALRAGAGSGRKAWRLSAAGWVVLVAWIAVTGVVFDPSLNTVNMDGTISTAD